MWFHSLAAGVDGYLKNLTITKCGLFTRAYDVFGREMTSYCLNHILMDTQKYFEYREHQHNKDWVNIIPTPLTEVKAIILGTGSIGSEIATTLSSLGIEVIGFSRLGKPKAGFSNVITSFDNIPSDTDWIISVLPLTSETKCLLNTYFFKHFSNAGFINVGRGGCINEPDLINALNNGNIKNAYLDVMTIEPLPISSPLWEHDKIFITPHISARSNPISSIQCLEKTYVNIIADEKIPNLVSIDNQY